MILDPTTGKMEYKIKRNEAAIKGAIIFDSTSTITVSPVNFHGLPKYDGCCFYIGTPQKKDYFLCAETPGAARAWVSTLHAAQLVLRAHKEAVNSLTGNGSSSNIGTVATVVAAANSTALEARKEIEAAMKISMQAALGIVTKRSTDDQMDDLSIMKETLRVKDEELQQLSKNIRARDSTIKEIAEKLNETAQAAEAAAAAAHAMDEQRRIVCTEIERIRTEYYKQLETLTYKLRDSEEKTASFSKERELLLKQRDSALQEAHMWRSELAKAREHAVILEAALQRARVSEADAEGRLKDAAEKQVTAAKEKEELLAYVNILKSQIERQESNTKQVVQEKQESRPGVDSPLPLTKHVDHSQDNVDKACLTDSRPVPVLRDGEVQLAVDRVDIHSIGDAEWSDIQTNDSRIADLRDISPEAEGSSLDILVVNSSSDHHPPEVSSPRP